MNLTPKLKQWYSRSDIKFNIIKYTSRRETAFLVPSWISDNFIKKRSVRNIRCHSVQHWDYITNKGLRMFDPDKNTPYNIYSSVATYREGLPMQTFNFKVRDNTEWNETHWKHMTAYDCFIDIDAGDFEDIGHAYNSFRAVMGYFDALNVPYEARFSGKGFHLIIPFEYFNSLDLNFIPFHDESYFKLFSKISRYLNDKFSEMIDTGIYDSRRVCKIPYTWVLYDDYTYLSYQFISLNEIHNFNIDDLSIDNFDRLMGKEYKNRFRMIFNKDGNVTKLLKEVL